MKGVLLKPATPDPELGTMWMQSTPPEVVESDRFALEEMYRLLNCRRVDVLERSVPMPDGRRVSVDVWVDDEFLYGGQHHNPHAVMLTGTTVSGNALVLACGEMGETIGLADDVIAAILEFCNNVTVIGGGL